MDFFDPWRQDQLEFRNKKVPDGYENYRSPSIQMARLRGILREDEEQILHGHGGSADMIGRELVDEHSRYGFIRRSDNRIGPHWQKLRTGIGKKALHYFLEFTPPHLLRPYILLGDTLDHFLEKTRDIQLKKLPPAVVTIMMQLQVTRPGELQPFTRFIEAEAGTIERLGKILSGPIDPALFTHPLGQELLRHCPTNLLATIIVNPGWIEQTKLPDGQAASWLEERLPLFAGDLGRALMRSPKAAERFFTTSQVVLEFLVSSGLSERALVLVLNSQALPTEVGANKDVVSEDLRLRLELLQLVPPDLLRGEASSILVIELINSRVSFIQALRQYIPAEELQKKLATARGLEAVVETRVSSQLIWPELPAKQYTDWEQRDAVPVVAEQLPQTATAHIESVVNKTNLNELLRKVVSRITLKAHPPKKKTFTASAHPNTHEISIEIAPEKIDYAMVVYFLGHELGHIIHFSLGRLTEAQALADRSAVLSASQRYVRSPYVDAIGNLQGRESRAFLNETFAEDVALFLLAPEVLSEGKKQLYTEISTALFPNVDLVKTRGAIKEFLERDCGIAQGSVVRSANQKAIEFMAEETAEHYGIVNDWRKQSKAFRILREDMQVALTKNPEADGIRAALDDQAIYTLMVNLPELLLTLCQTGTATFFQQISQQPTVVSERVNYIIMTGAHDRLLRADIQQVMEILTVSKEHFEGLVSGL